MKVNPLWPFVFYVCGGVAAARFVRNLLVQLMVKLSGIGEM
jgi:hypothetical protein